jgi:ketosteroid isomerase-like protein
MSLPASDRDALFKTFGRAWFKKDAELLYEATTPDFVWNSHAPDGSVRTISGKASVAAALTDTSGPLENVRFHDVVYHHAPEASFMTFRITGTEKATGRPCEEVGVERYTFRDGRIAVKDVYRKQAGG